MQITVTITRSDNTPPPVPGSISHAAIFTIAANNHYVLCLARDVAEAVALAYLIHGDELREAEAAVVKESKSK